jgi:hypothetical protein
MSAFGKSPLGNDSAQRIRDQTAKNTENLLRQQLQELGDANKGLVEQRLADHMEKLADIRTLISFIVDSGMSLTPDVEEMIAKYMEQTMAGTDALKQPSSITVDPAMFEVSNVHRAR